MCLYGNLIVFKSCLKILGLSSPPASVSPVEGQACVTMYGLLKNPLTVKIFSYDEISLNNSQKASDLLYLMF